MKSLLSCLALVALVAWLISQAGMVLFDSVEYELRPQIERVTRGEAQR